MGAWWGILRTSQASEAPSLLTNGHLSSDISIEIDEVQSIQLQNTADKFLSFTSVHWPTRSQQSQHTQISTWQATARTERLSLTESSQK